MLTNIELQVLDAILEVAFVKSKEEDDGDPVFHEVEVNCVNPSVAQGDLASVYTSLANKGLIECSGFEDSNGNGVMEYVCITPRGLEALMSVKGVH